MTAVRHLAGRQHRERPVRLWLVRPSAPRELGWRATVAVCVIGSFAALVASVAVQGQRISLQEEADRIAARTAVAKDRNRQLRIEIIQAESPGHVLDVARKAGMVDPGPIALIPAVSATATSATAASATAVNAAAASATAASATAVSATVPSVPARSGARR